MLCAHRRARSVFFSLSLIQCILYILCLCQCAYALNSIRKWIEIMCVCVWWLCAGWIWTVPMLCALCVCCAHGKLYEMNLWQAVCNKCAIQKFGFLFVSRHVCIFIGVCRKTICFIPIFLTISISHGVTVAIVAIDGPKKKKNRLGGSFYCR